MKKFTLLIASLFITIGAMAQFDANKYYTVVAEGHSKGGSPAWAVNDDGTSFVSTGNTTIANEAQKYFAFITCNEATYIYSVSAKKFVKNNASLVAASGDAVTIEALTGTNAGKYLFKFDNDHFINIGGSKQMVIDGWGDGANEVDGGNTMTVTEAGEFTAEDLAEATNMILYTPNFTGAKTRTAERKIASFTVNDDTYTLTSNEQLQNYVVKTDKVFTVGAGSEVTVAMTQSDGSWMNAFVYVDTDNNGFTAGIADDNYTPTGDLVSYSFYNQGYSDDNNGRNSAGTSISGGNRSTLALPTFTAPSTPGTYRLRAKYDWCNINPAGDTGTYFGNTFTGHGAAIIDFTIVVTEPLPEFNATYRLTDQTGNVYEGQFVYNTQNHPVLTGAHSATFSNEAWDEANLLYTATVDFGFPVSKKDGATNEILLTINNKYVRNIDDDVKMQAATVAAVNANCLWAIYPKFTDGAFTYTIMNVSTGKFLNTAATAGQHNTQGTVVLSTTATEFTVVSDNDFKVVGKELYLSVNSPANDTDVYLGVHGNAHAGTNIIAAKLPYYEVDITEAKYATFYAPVAVEIPENVTAHTVTINGEWATLSDPLEVIPAYTGVVLYAETAQTYTFNVTTTDVTVENNALKGTVAATNVTADAYVLGYINVAEEGEEEKKEVGFYTATKNQADNTAFLNNHHKAYLPKTAGMNAASYSFRFGGGTTGVEKVEIRNEKSEIYDLTGRRVESIAAPGIYVVNGKKVLVK